MEKYKVIFSGEVTEALPVEKVKENIATLFKLDDKKADMLFYGIPVIIKKNLDKEMAGRYQQAIARAGGFSQVVKMEDGQKREDKREVTQKIVDERISSKQAQDDHIGKYRIIKTLGKGAMGTVYQGYDVVMDRQVAIKVLHPHLLQDRDAGEFLERFKREAQIAGKYLHRNIVTVFDYGESNDCPYIVMEFIEGTELVEYLAENNKLQVPVVVDLILQLLDALSYLHQQGVIHRDIKPANIILLNDGTLKLADFGVARIDNSDMTQIGHRVGTRSYMSPEQFRGEMIDHRSDLFAVAVVLFELLTSIRYLVASVSSSRIEDIEMLAGGNRRVNANAQIPRSFLGLFNNALARDKRDRYQSAGDFTKALQQALQEYLRDQPANEEREQTVVQAVNTADSTILQTSLPVTDDRQVWFSRNEAESLDEPEQEISELLITETEKLLVFYMGPIANLLVRQMVEETSSIRELYFRLAEEIPDDEERQEFLQKGKKYYHS